MNDNAEKPTLMRFWVCVVDSQITPELSAWEHRPTWCHYPTMGHDDCGWYVRKPDADVTEEGVFV